MPSAKTITLDFSADLPASGIVAVPAAKDAASFGAIDQTLGGALARAAKAAGFDGKSGDTVLVPGPDGMAGVSVLIIGVGEAAKFDTQAAQAFGGRAVAYALSKTEALAVALSGTSIGEVDAETFAVSAATGAKLRAYAFESYKTKPEPGELSKLAAITVVTDEAGAKAAFADAASVAEGVALARDLVSEPPNVLYPESFALRCEELSSLGVKVRVLGEAEMEALGMGSLLGVGQGSVKESKMAIMEWQGAGDEAPIALIGKGVTFDTGGISLKPGAGMEEMKMDMGGAAAVTGAMRALAGRKAKANVVGLIGLVENMPDGDAIRPADILTSMSGQTIEVLNTDAEGRLVMADVLTYAERHFKPAVMLDLATLTGAILVALADQYAGLFTEDEDLAEALMAAGDASGDKLWRMPLGDAHRDMIKSDIADMKNIGGRDGGSSSAAAFLSRFVENTSWAHLDIAGMAWAKKDRPLCPKGATGYGVRLLDDFVRTRMG